MLEKLQGNNYTFIKKQTKKTPKTKKKEPTTGNTFLGMIQATNMEDKE